MQTTTDAPAPARDWTESLLELLETQHGLVNELAGLASMQAELIRERRTDALLGLLTRRERIIERFTASQEELTGLTDGLDSRLDGVEEGRRDRIQTLLADIGDRLAQVMERDEADQNVLAAERRHTGEEVHAMSTARAARAAYRGGGGGQSNRFADRKG